MPHPFLSVVIPAFNEAGRITDTLNQVVHYLDSHDFSWEVVVVDDGSTDKTGDLVLEFARDDSRVTLLPVTHKGKGWAVRCGMLHVTGQLRFLCDADLSMPIEHLGRFLPPVQQEYDIAIGSRETTGARRFGEPVIRHLSGRLFNLLVRLIAVRGISDTQCGFKCFGAKAANQLFRIQQLDGFGFDVEVLLVARHLGMRLVEVPIDWHYRQQSKVRLLRDAPAMTWNLLATRWRHRGRRTNG